MLSFGEKITQNSSIDTALCIVGAGAAGISIAREFVNSHIKVVLLESGSFEYETDTQDLYNGSSIGREYFPLIATRLRYFGGSTNHWGGQCGPLDKLDFMFREWVPKSGWPLSYEELKPYYRKAQKILEMGPYDYSSKFWEEVIAAKILPLNPNKFSSNVRQYSPPTRFGKKYRKEIVDSKNINLMLNANAIELVTNKSCNIVTSVRVSSLSGNEFNINVKKVIIASGGLENPRILLLSNKVNQAGLGNDYDQVGRNFLEHPHWQCGKIMLTEPDRDIAYYDAPPIRRKPGIRAAGIIIPTEMLQRKEKLLNSLFTLEPEYEQTKDNIITQKVDGLIEHIGKAIRRKKVIDRHTYRKYFERSNRIEYITVKAATEQMPNSNSRVSLSNKLDSLGQKRIELDWKFNEPDSLDIERTSVLLAQELGASGIGRMKVDVSPLPGWPGGNHHMGTTKMSKTKKEGVVDSNCKVFGINNLYVAGSSVFPTGGAVNPTFTIVALSLRLAAHLKEKLL